MAQFVSDTFPGTALGNYWVWDAGSGAGVSYAVNGGLTITIPGGINVDVPSSPAGVDSAPGVHQIVDDVDFDIAVRFDSTDMTDWVSTSSNKGHGFVVFGDPTSDADLVRAGVYSTGVGPRGYTYARAGGATITGPLGDISSMAGIRGGIVSWLRLKYVQSTHQWTFYRSGDGTNWTQVDQFTANVPARRIKIFTQAKTVGYIGKIGKVINLGVDNNVGLLSSYTTGRVWSTTFSGGTLPSWLSDASNVSTNGGVTVTTGAATLKTDLADGQTLANGALGWSGPTDFTDVDFYARYRHTVGDQRAFGVVALQDNGTNIDVYMLGAGYCLESNGGNDTTVWLRVDRTDPTRAGDMNFYPYTYLVETTVTGIAAVTMCTRIQRIGKRLRAKHWIESAGEPSTWLYDGEDVGWRQSVFPQLVLGRNPTTLGVTGIKEMAVYEVVVTELLVHEPKWYRAKSGSLEAVNMRSARSGAYKLFDVQR